MLKGLLYIVTVFALSDANADIKIVIEKITAELGSGRVTVSSYLHYTAEYCLERLDKSITVGQESLNCYTNAYRTHEKTHNVTPKDKLKLSEEENWDRLCHVWPLLSACHRETTLPATDQCYQQLHSQNNGNSRKQNISLLQESLENVKRGSDALSFTDAYINFQCKDINRTVDVLDLAKPRRLICFKDLKDNINNCTKMAVDELGFTEFNLRMTLLLIRNCYEQEYTKYAQYCSRKSSNAGKVIPFIKDMFDHINQAMFEKDKFDKHGYIRNADTEIQGIATKDLKMEETKKNIDSKITDKHLNNFLSIAILHDTEKPEENSTNASTSIGNSSLTNRRFYQGGNHDQEDHRVYPDHNRDKHNSNSASKSKSNSKYTLGILILSIITMIYRK